MAEVQLIDLSGEIKADTRGMSFFPWQGRLKASGDLLPTFHLISIRPGHSRGHHLHPGQAEYLYPFHGRAVFIWEAAPGQVRERVISGDRTQPGLPMKKGRLGTMTHDYKRHGTTTLFAALNVLDGTVIGKNMQRHRHQEFIRFLNTVNAQIPDGKAVQVILDNYATHKHPKVRAWLDRHARFTFHFTPTSASWLNAVEGFFAILARRRLKRGVFRSLADLQAAINRFLVAHNRHTKPFTWTADPDKIIAAVKRGHQVLDSIH